MRERCVNPQPGSLRDGVANVLWPLVLGLTFTLWLSGGFVQGAALLFVEEPKIVSQQALSGACIDGNGDQRGDLEEWTSQPSACDNVICHVEPSGNYTVTQSCRPREPYENPDEDNCEWISNMTLTYPDCCPQLSCGTASTLTTLDPLLCHDLATAFACGVWYNLTSGCNMTSVDVFNFSQVFCQNTCGLC